MVSLFVDWWMANWCGCLLPQPFPNFLQLYSTFPFIVPQEWQAAVRRCDQAVVMWCCLGTTAAGWIRVRRQRRLSDHYHANIIIVRNIHEIWRPNCTPSLSSGIVSVSLVDWFGYGHQFPFHIWAAAFLVQWSTRPPSKELSICNCLASST